MNGLRIGQHLLTWVNDSRVRLPSQPAKNSVVEIRRVTPIEQAAVQFHNGSNLTQEELNKAVAQLLFHNQETEDSVTGAIDRARIRLGDQLGVVTTPEAIMDELVRISDLGEDLLNRFRVAVAGVDLNAAEIIQQALQLSNFENNIGVVNSTIDGVGTRTAALESQVDSIQGVVDGLLGVGDGQGIATVIAEERTQRIDGDNAIVQTVDLIGAKNGSNTGFIVNQNTLRLSPTETIGQRFNAINAAAGDSLSRIIAEETARATAVAAEAGRINTLITRVGAAESSITSEATARTTADTAFAQTLGLLGSKTANGTAFVLDQAKTMVSPTETLGQKFTAILSQAANGTQAQVAAETTARTTAIAAEASARQALATQVAANLSSAISTEQTARTTAISAETLARQQLAAVVGQNTAAIQNEASARSTADQTFAQQFSLLGATTAGGSAWNLNMNTVQIGGGISMATRLSGIDTQLGNNSAAIANEITARTDAVSSVAQSLQTVNSTVGNLSASVTTLSSATNGLLSRWGVALNNNGHIIGISLNNSGPAAGSLNMVADEFAFVSPNGGTPVKIVSMNGSKVRFNTNVEMAGDLLVEGTIHNSKLTQNTVTNVEAAYNAGAVGLNNSTPTRIHGLWIGVEKPNSPIDITFNTWATFTHNAGGSFVATVQLVRSRGNDGGTVISSFNINGSGMANDTWQGAIPVMYLDRPNEAGNWHYYVQIYFNVGNMSTQTVTARYGKLIEMKNNTASIGGGTGSGAGVGSGGGSGGGGGGFDPPGGGGGGDVPIYQPEF